MLAPDLNSGMTAGMDHVDVNDHLDDTRRGHETNLGLMRVNGRDRGTSLAHLETQEEKAHGNSMETPRENDKTVYEDSKMTELKLNPHEHKRHHRISIHKS